MWLLLIEILCNWLLALRDAFGAAISGAMQGFFDQVVGPLGEACFEALLRLAAISALVVGGVVLIAVLLWRSRTPVQRPG